MSEHLRLGRIGRLGRISGIPIGLSLSLAVVVVLVVAMAAPQTLPEAARGYPDAAYWAVGLLAGSLLFASLSLSLSLSGTVTAGDTNRQRRRAALTAGSR